MLCFGAFLILKNVFVKEKQPNRNCPDNLKYCTTEVYPYRPTQWKLFFTNPVLFGCTYFYYSGHLWKSFFSHNILWKSYHLFAQNKSVVPFSNLIDCVPLMLKETSLCSVNTFLLLKHCKQFLQYFLISFFVLWNINLSKFLLHR